MICLMIWSLAAAGGVGPIFYQGEKIAATSNWSASWLMMAGINQAIGGKAAGMTNSSDFSRYAKKKSDYLIGTISVYWLTGVLVCFGGLVTTAACQKIYGTIYWNPPDLLMVIMDRKFRSPPILVSDTHISPNRWPRFVRGTSSCLLPRFIVCFHIDVRERLLQCRGWRYRLGRSVPEVHRHSTRCTYYVLRRLDHPAVAADQPGSDLHRCSELIRRFPGPHHGCHGLRLLRTPTRKSEAVASFHS